LLRLDLPQHRAILSDAQLIGEPLRASDALIIASHHDAKDAVQHLMKRKGQHHCRP
jgi:hypothetical protein